MRLAWDWRRIGLSSPSRACWRAASARRISPNRMDGISALPGSWRCSTKRCNARWSTPNATAGAYKSEFGREPTLAERHGTNPTHHRNSSERDLTCWRFAWLRRIGVNATLTYPQQPAACKTGDTRKRGADAGLEAVSTQESRTKLYPHWVPTGEARVRAGTLATFPC